MRKKVLITGATGNVGLEVIRQLLLLNNNEIEIIAGVRNIEKSKKLFPEDKTVTFRYFDFDDELTFKPALAGVDCVFLLRPPQSTDIQKVYEPLIREISFVPTRQVIFLSVQGVEKASFIPHHKIEKLILKAGLPYVFLRPSYFMQNLTTTLRDDIVKRHEIFLPAGNALFNWVDISNIAEVAARMIIEFDKYKNQAFEITGDENLSFNEVTQLLNNNLPFKISYHSPSLIRFILTKHKQGITLNYILVMILLHYVPRFQKPPQKSAVYKQLTGRNPTTLNEFIKKHILLFQ